MLTDHELHQLELLENESDETRILIDKLLESHKYMIGKISHEIRNPLTLVSSSMQMIASMHPEVTTYKYWNESITGLDFAISLLEDLSAFNNGTHLYLSQFSLQELLKNIVVSFAASLVDCEIEFTSSIHLNPDAIEADRKKLAEVFLNLLRNAKDAVAGHGHITLIAKNTTDYFSVSIKDDGCGILPEYLDTLFDPFVTHKTDGTGLGLALVKTIIDSHHGLIHVDSIPSVHTTFTILLPIEQNSQKKSGN